MWIYYTSFLFVKVIYDFIFTQLTLLNGTSESANFMKLSGLLEEVKKIIINWIFCSCQHDTKKIVESNYIS